MGPDLAVQTALRARLVASGTVTALVPADAILDRNATPAPRPSIVIGESQIIDEGEDVARKRLRVFHTIHIWRSEPSTVGVKGIAEAVRQALLSARLALGPGWHCADQRIANVRTKRDPDGETSHAVVAFDVLVVEQS